MLHAGEKISIRYRVLDKAIDCQTQHVRTLEGLLNAAVKCKKKKKKIGRLKDIIATKKRNI